MATSYVHAYYTLKTYKAFKVRHVLQKRDSETVYG